MPLPLIIIGAGGHAKVLIGVLQLQSRDMLFVTDNEPQRHGQSIDGIPIRGNDELVLQYKADEVQLVNAVGSIAIPETRRNVYERFLDLGYNFAAVIHPGAVIAPQTAVGNGVQVMAGAVIQPHVRIEDNVLINTRASIDHDCVVGAHAHVAPGATISGGVHIGDTAHIGTGATVIQSVRIGCRTLVGAGAVVLHDLPEASKAWGVPARIIDSS